jgi:hypothetical protein
VNAEARSQIGLLTDLLLAQLTLTRTGGGVEGPVMYDV